MLLILMLGGMGAMIILPMLLRGLKGGGSLSPQGEVANDIFTVSKVQVALLANARQIQETLTQVSLDIDTGTPEGLMQLLQESALALLRHSDYWTHVSAQSQTVRDGLEAEKLLNQLQMVERSRLSAETLVNVGGKIRRQQVVAPGLEEDPAAYIVVTLLVGTAHDQPLFQEIRNSTELQRFLETVGSLPPEYLMVFELIWSPQDASDSLTEEELLTEYSDLLPL